jgi:hypothetical protein
MTVNSSRGPLNWIEYDSALDTTEAQPPAAGSDVGWIHASRDSGVAILRAGASGTRTVVLPVKPTDGLVSFGSSDAWPRAGLPL